MSKGIEDPILYALRSYEHAPNNGKRALLLTVQGGYFLYGERFCGIQDYEMELWAEGCQIRGTTVREPLFFALYQEHFHAVSKRPLASALVSLIFHIDLGAEDGLLRGILLAQADEARIALFCDAAIEDLYRLSRRTDILPAVPVPADNLLRQEADALRRADLHGLTGLYLQSKRLNAHSAEELLGG